MERERERDGGVFISPETVGTGKSRERKKRGAGDGSADQFGENIFSFFSSSSAFRLPGFSVINTHNTTIARVGSALPSRSQNKIKKEEKNDFAYR
jgi:hypothetical protein